MEEQGTPGRDVVVLLLDEAEPVFAQRTAICDANDGYGKVEVD